MAIGIMQLRLKTQSKFRKLILRKALNLCFSEVKRIKIYSFLKIVKAILRILRATAMRATFFFSLGQSIADKNLETRLWRGWR